MKLLLIVLISITLYNGIAIWLKIPAFQIRRARSMMQGYAKSGWLTDQLQWLSLKLSKHIELTLMKQDKLQTLLTLAHSSEIPAEFVARRYVYAALPLLLLPVIAMSNPVLCAFPILLSAYLYRRCYNVLVEEGNKRKRKIENEILKFTMYMTSSLKSERNMVRLIEQYNENFHTPLTEELSYTLSDMKTGNYEKALQKMAKRNNSTAVDRLVQGLISALSGNDMTVYFENLSYELTGQWEQTLKRQALAKEPKISRLSMLLFVVAVVTIFAVLLTGLTSSDLLFGGM